MTDKKMEETFGGYVLHNVPFPEQLDEAALKSLKAMGPILIEQPYSITYLHSFGQDSPFFAGLANGLKCIIASETADDPVRAGGVIIGQFDVFRIW